MNKGPSEPIPLVESNDVAGERIICVVARDVLSLERQDAGSGALTASIWKGRWVILAFVLGFATLATVYALVASAWYTAEVVLTPAGTKNGQGLGLSSQLQDVGLLAGLAGSIGLGGSRTAEPIAVLKSRDLARKFIEEQGLLHVLLAEKWDARAGRWKESDPRRQPDIRDAIEYFDKAIMQVTEDKKTGLVTVAIRWKDATVAASWANRIVDLLNEQMSSRALTEGEANVAFLQKELATTAIVEVKQPLSRLLETELQKVMIARGDKQYAFRIIDHADVPKLRSWPKRRVIVALGILAGGLAGLAAVFGRERLARISREAT